MSDAMRAGAQRLGRYLDDLGANATVPPADVLNRPPTPADVKAYPAYFILGPGWDIAGKTDCGHGYFLTDSCPNCDND